MATNPLPSVIEPVVDGNMRWSPIWYRWIKPLLESVRSASDSVQEEFDDINGKWVLSVNANGRVTGYIKLDGSQPQSAFTVLADKFTVVHPSVNGTTIEAFIVGLVGGVSTVGVDGDVLVDGTVKAPSIAAGTITADKLDVSTLSAITANLGTLTAGLIQSTDGSSFWNLDTGEFQIGD